LFIYDGAGLCQYLSNEGLDSPKLKASLQNAIKVFQRLVDIRLAEVEQKTPRAQKLLDAWNERKNQIEKGLEQQTGTASTVANYLPWIIAAFCLFALLIFILLMKFPEKPQMELIASGQVIQFATVMVLLIVVCILGMAKFITDSTLGTLLGGISGYVCLKESVVRKDTRP
jgi:hypothetical protein